MIVSPGLNFCLTLQVRQMIPAGETWKVASRFSAVCVCVCVAAGCFLQCVTSLHVSAELRGVAPPRCHAIILSACLQGAVISPTTGGDSQCLWEASAAPPSGFTLSQAVISQIFVFPPMIPFFFPASLSCSTYSQFFTQADLRR